MGSARNLLIVLCLHGLLGSTAWAQFPGYSGNPGERMFGYMDRNRDGRLDRDEMERMPSSFRGWLEENGYGRRSIDQDEFNRIAPRMMESLRGGMSRGDGTRIRFGGPGYGGPGFGGAPGFGGPGFGGGSFDRGSFGSWSRSGDQDDDDRRSYDRSSGSSDRDRRDQSSSRSSGYTPAPRTPVTVPLPQQFVPHDQDGDGQIGLYEWKTVFRSELPKFFEYDKNGDGFLTPKELSNVPAPTPSPTAAPANVAQPAPPSTVTPATRPVAPSNSAPTPTDGKTALATTSQPAASGDTTESRQAEYFFRRLDRNQNKTVDPEEWAITRTLRPMFEQAGVDLTQAMSHEQFVQSYVRVVAAERK